MRYDPRPDDDEPITPEWLVSIGLRGVEQCDGTWMEYSTIFTKGWRRGDPVVAFTFLMTRTGAYGRREIKRKVPVFDWATVGTGRIWQYGAGRSKKKRFTPTRGQVRMLFLGLGLKVTA